MDIHDLPDEVLLIIFGFLEMEDVLHLRQTCTRWRCLSEDKAIWANLDLAVKFEEKKDALVFLQCLQFAPALNGVIWDSNRDLYRDKKDSHWSSWEPVRKACQLKRTPIPIRYIELCCEFKDYPQCQLTDILHLFRDYVELIAVDTYLNDIERLSSKIDFSRLESLSTTYSMFFSYDTDFKPREDQPWLQLRNTLKHLRLFNYKTLVCYHYPGLVPDVLNKFASLQSVFMDFDMFSLKWEMGNLRALSTDAFDFGDDVSWPRYDRDEFSYVELESVTRLKIGLDRDTQNPLSDGELAQFCNKFPNLEKLVLAITGLRSECFNEKDGCDCNLYLLSAAEIALQSLNNSLSNKVKDVCLVRDSDHSMKTSMKWINALNLFREKFPGVNISFPAISGTRLYHADDF